MNLQGALSAPGGPGRGRLAGRDALGVKGEQEHGATAVEFSLIATLLFVLLFGILQFGLAYNRQQGLHAAAREGARLASLGDEVDADDVRARVREAAPGFVADGDLDERTVAITPADWCQQATDPTVSVTVSLDGEGPLPGLSDEELDRYRASIPVIGTFLPDFTVTATFMCETERTS